MFDLENVQYKKSNEFFEFRNFVFALNYFSEKTYIKIYFRKVKFVYK